MPQLKTGTLVWANTGDNDFIGIYVRSEGDKDIIQEPKGHHTPCAYREPESRDDNGAGLTWWLIPQEDKAPAPAASTKPKREHKEDNDGD